MAVNPLLLPVEVSGRYWEETQGCGGFFTGFRRTSGASSVAPLSRSLRNILQADSDQTLPEEPQSLHDLI